MDNDKLITGKAYLGNERIYYHGYVTDTEIVVERLVNPEIVDGINNREVNKAKGV
jgi:hypothetical protein